MLIIINIDYNSERFIYDGSISKNGVVKMIKEKTKVGILVGFISMILVILVLFVPVSTIIFALLIGFLFVLPILALASILIIGASAVSKKLKRPSKLEKEVVVPVSGSS